METLPGPTSAEGVAVPVPMESLPIPIDATLAEEVPASDAVVPLLESEAEPGEGLPIEPTWYNPLNWLRPFWDGTFEIGLNGSEGNANSLSIRTGFDLSRETEFTNWELDVTYAKSTANGQETQHNALVYSNWDYKLANPRWSWFNKTGLEYDEFKNFDVRLFGNTGIGYLFVDNDRTQLRGRFGAGTSREFGGIDEQWKAEAVFGFDFAHQITEKQKFSAVVDYYPTFDDFSDYRVVSDVGWTTVIDAAANLSLKVGVINRYDSTPNGAEALDTDYSLLFLWTL